MAKSTRQYDPDKPWRATYLSLLVKLGSIAVHVDELLGPTGDEHFDKAALETLLRDREVKEWVAAMSKEGFLPAKR